MIPLTDSCTTEKIEDDNDCSERTVESNSELTCLKQEEESLNPDGEPYVDQKDSMNGQDLSTEVQNTEDHNENVDISDQEANSEIGMGVPPEGSASTMECVNKFDHLTLKEDSPEEDEDLANGFDKLTLKEDVGSDTDSFSELDNSETKMYEIVNEDPETAFCTLASREAINTEENSVLHCLYQFTHKEKLCGNNKLLCDICTRRQHCGPKTAGKSMLNSSLLKAIFAFFSYQPNLILMTYQSSCFSRVREGTRNACPAFMELSDCFYVAVS